MALPVLRIFLLFLLVSGVSGETQGAKSSPAQSPSSPPLNVSGQRDFDFLFGSWHVENHRLRHRFQNSNDWETFGAKNTVRPIWNGRGNVEEYQGSASAGPIEGLTVRLFNTKTNEWGLYWADQQSGRMYPPVVGRFVNGRGEFFGHDSDGGRPVTVRFIWSEMTADSCKWEQAFSLDEGRTWETNWIMRMTRIIEDTDEAGDRSQAR